ncbi:MAG: sulfite exporter TauE/SafE family protein [Lautropia sp.]
MEGLQGLLHSLVPAALTPVSMGLLLLASMLTSAVAAAFGIGGGVGMIAVLLTALPPTVVVPLHGVIQAGSNLGRAITMRADISRSIVPVFAAGSLVGVGAGSLLVVNLPTRVLQVVLGLFILWSLWFPGLKASRIPDRGFFWVGAGASFCTMFLGATGPLIGAFWNVEKLGRKGVVATHAACMSVQHVFKVAAFVALGFVFAPWIPFLAAMIAAGFVGTLLGKRVLSRLPERVFAGIFKGVLSLLALELLRSALTGH